jgi:hypothetical protein
VGNAGPGNNYHRKAASFYQTQRPWLNSGDGAMTNSLKQQIAECYRRAEEYRRLFNQSSNLNERKSFFLTSMHLTRLADDMRSQLREKDRE